MSEEKMNEETKRNATKPSNSIADFIQDLIAIGAVARDPVRGLHVAQPKLLEWDDATRHRKLHEAREARLAASRRRS